MSKRNNYEFKVDDEKQSEVETSIETPSIEYQKSVRQAAEDLKAKKEFKVVEKYFIQNKDKIIEVFKKKNGNKIRSFAFTASKFPERVKELKEKGLLR